MAESLTSDERRAVVALIDRALLGVTNHVEREWLRSAREKLGAYLVVEIDNMTGNERELDNYANSPWTRTFSREAAEESVAWRKEHITGRYSYEIREASDQ